ncbi:RluA family pseudouridine synthase [Tissierella creatinophila]|uniref:Pseudouridine synthase n=1 Tax=Tissierella creatinophila DSM 6911 TaxID=1123403 RepID=A0A1U7M5G6_TISCR|nr:RluA family pseudouridine synthase [Tissierella creatinophila]OLS02531.1 ribosomal large subunit pseudouridine synthase D [Tissierella creatinophila DSM 6911]
MNYFNQNENIVIFECKDNEKSLEQFLINKNISSRLFRKLYRYKNILVNGEHRRKDLPMKSGDRVILIMEDEINNIESEKMDLDIIYEDFDLLILNKPENTVVHLTKSHQKGTLSNGITYYFKEKNIKKKVRFVNRLDMDTTGILIVAKNPFAHQQLALQFEEETVVKKYLAVVEGIVESEENVIDLPIGRKEDGSIKKMVDKNGQRAITKYRVKKRFKTSTLLEVQIFTGRSHQIRVHLNHIGHPIIGDKLYYKEDANIDRQALHSNYLRLKHPRTGEDIEFIAELPSDMQRLIKLMKD